MTLRLTLLKTGLLLALGMTFSANAQSVPDALVQPALQNYPKDILCYMQDNAPEVRPNVPLSQDVSKGWLTAYLGQVSPGGNQIAVVVYGRNGGGEWCEEKVFQLVQDQWQLMPVNGHSDYTLQFERVEGSDDIVFSDIDKDGTNEIILYNHPDAGNHPSLSGTENREAVVVLAMRSGNLVSITPTHQGYETTSCGDHVWAINPNLPGGPSQPQQTTFFIPKKGKLEPMTLTTAGGQGAESDTGVGFVDLDGDGIPELLLYPDLGGQWTDPGTGQTFTSNPTTGTRVYKLIDGIYQFQYETPVGTSGTPEAGVAIKPASVPASELQAVGSSPGKKAAGRESAKGSDDAITLYVMPPDGFSLSDVNWSTLRVGDFAIAPTVDKGVSPAPYPASVTPSGWLATDTAGQTMFLETLDQGHMGQFQQTDKDPVIYPGPSGALHMTTPFHVFGFSKQQVFAWLLGQWPKAQADATATACVPQGNHQDCFVPVTLPIKADLANGHGVVMGGATLWVDTGAQASSATKETPPAKAKG